METQNKKNPNEIDGLLTDQEGGQISASELAWARSQTDVFIEELDIEPIFED